MHFIKVNNNKTSNKGVLSYADDIDDCLSNADAAIIMTEWEDYKKIKWKSYERKMNKPAWVFDTRYILNEKDFENCDLKFWQIGNIKK